MKRFKRINLQRERRRYRVRNHQKRGSADKPRLAVFRSNRHMYCQVIDDEQARTLCSASTRDRDIQDEVNHGGNREAAALIGKKIAERATQAGIKRVAFDRGVYRYHGRVAELADAAREAGLEF